MTVRGWRRGKRKELPDGLHRYHRELVEKLGELVDAVDWTQRECGKKFDSSRMVVYRLLTGEKPSVHTLSTLVRHMCSVVAKECSARGIDPPYTWDDLKELVAATSFQIQAESGAPRQEPNAGSPVESAAAAVPVQAEQGDRQGTGKPELVVPGWDAADDLHRWVATADWVNLASVMLHVGANASIDEVAAAVVGSSSILEGQLADGILTYAARREPDEVMAIARALLNLGAVESARRLLDLAAASKGRY